MIDEVNINEININEINIYALYIKSFFLMDGDHALMSRSPPALFMPTFPAGTWMNALVSVKDLKSGFLLLLPQDKRFPSLIR